MAEEEVLPEEAAELGHTTTPEWAKAFDAISNGFCSTCIAVAAEPRPRWATLAALAAAQGLSAHVSTMAKSLRYQYNYNREQWENEYDKENESVEFTQLLSSLGVPPDEGYEFAERLAAYPHANVTTHLMLELGTLPPRQSPVSTGCVAAAGYSVGMLVALALRAAVDAGVQRYRSHSRSRAGRRPPPSASPPAPWPCPWGTCASATSSGDPGTSGSTRSTCSPSWPRWPRRRARSPFRAPPAFRAQRRSDLPFLLAPVTA